MLSKRVRFLLQTLITLLGAGAGAALTMLGLRLYDAVMPAHPLPLGIVVTFYVLVCTVAAMTLMFFSDRIIDWVSAFTTDIVDETDRLTPAQLLGGVVGLIAGLAVAALSSQVLHFMGTGVFITALIAILHVALGVTGWTVGRRRSRDVGEYLLQGDSEGKKSRRFRLHRREKAPQPAPSRVKLLDSSAIIDGRIAAVCRTGFIDGDLSVPQFVLDELRHLADSADPMRRSRGRRGLDILQRMREDPRLHLTVDNRDYPDIAEVDVKLLRLAADTGAAVVTNDFNLNKVANVTGVTVLNLNELSSALRTSVSMGDELTVDIVKEGKEATQGVGYMEDGTMIVVEGGRSHIGSAVDTVVTSVLQTSAGRMVFCRVKD